MRGIFRDGAAGFAVAGVGAAAGLQFEPIDHWLFVCDWASVRIRSETCFGDEARLFGCDWASARIRSDKCFGEQGADAAGGAVAGAVGAPVKAAMP